MKYIIAILSLSLLSFVSMDSLSDIAKAINTGDANNLTTFLDENVELALLGNGKIYGKKDAVETIQAFWEQHKPIKFVPMHEGATKGDDSRYCIGNLDTAEKSYRVYLFISVSGGKYLIQEMRVE